MVQGLIGKKLGMTQVFDSAGNAVAVTVIQAGPCVVVQKKTPEKEGYAAVQLGLVEPGRKIRVNRPLDGHFRKADAPPVKVLHEFRYEDEAEKPIQPGDQIRVQDVFNVDERVDVVGAVKGRGFQGVVKRHGFKGGRATHGSMFHRAPGSIGSSAFPSRVFAGMKGPGRMGGNQVKIRQLKVVGIDEENNLLLVKGSIPGSKQSYVYLERSGRF
ncbi:MAG TPA: 50S ribosomal protein L3 [Acidobacteriota bacterium]|nr:50S ribosomal protein L3 [Acidobacteriota bacterium]